MLWCGICVQHVMILKLQQDNLEYIEEAKYWRTKFFCDPAPVFEPRNRPINIFRDVRGGIA